MERQTRSRLVGDVIVPPTGFELIVADHCNIACRQCNHGSPVLPKWNVSPIDAERDLAILAEVYRPAYLKVLGGEPLLHPELPEVIRAARRSAITDHITLVTNGMLLNRLATEIWSLIDELEVSRYPGANLSDDLLERTKASARDHGVRFTINSYPEFRRTFTSRFNSDEEVVKKIFRACKLANVWGCHSLYRGRVYRCPQSVYAPKLFDIDVTEGIEVRDAPEFRDRLLAFLNDPEPLASCRHCAGTAGRKQEHKILPRRDWSADLDIPAEQMIDFSLLEQLLVEIVPVDDCKVPAEGQSLPWLRQLLPWKTTETEP